MTGLEAKMEIQDGGAIIVIMGDGTLGGAAIDVKSEGRGLLAYGIATALKDKSWREGMIKFAKKDKSCKLVCNLLALWLNLYYFVTVTNFGDSFFEDTT